MTCVRSLCGTGQPAAPGQVLFWAEADRAINAQRCHLCHLTLTGGLLVLVCLLDATKWRQLGDGKGSETKRQVIWKYSALIISPNRRLIFLLVVFQTIAVGCRTKKMTNYDCTASISGVYNVANVIISTMTVVLVCFQLLLWSNSHSFKKQTVTFKRRFYID